MTEVSEGFVDTGRSAVFVFLILILVLAAAFVSVFLLDPWLELGIGLVGDSA